MLLTVYCFTADTFILISAWWKKNFNMRKRLKSFTVNKVEVPK